MHIKQKNKNNVPMVEMSPVNSPQTSPQPSPKGEGAERGQLRSAKLISENKIQSGSLLNTFSNTNFVFRWSSLFLTPSPLGEGWGEVGKYPKGEGLKFEIVISNTSLSHPKSALDIEKLQNICFNNGLVKTRMIEFRSLINLLRKDEDVDGISKPFKKVITGLIDSQVDSLMLLMPEDEIEVQYKSTNASAFKSLSTA